MMATKLRRIDDFQRAVNALLGLVLPEFGIPCGFYTLWHSNRFARHFGGASSLLQCGEAAADCVIRIAKRPARRTESIKPVAPKSP
jgi:hypothetical protein